MMSSSESWLNPFGIDCVHSLCVCVLFLCLLFRARVRTPHAVHVRLCVFHLCEGGSGSPGPGLSISWLILPWLTWFVTVSPFFPLRAHSVPAELKWTATFPHKLSFNNYDLQACPPWQRQWNWCITVNTSGAKGLWFYILYIKVSTFFFFCSLILPIFCWLSQHLIIEE